MAKKILIIIGGFIILSGAGFAWYYYSNYGQQEDIVIDPNITEDYKESLQEELSGYQDELSQNPENGDLYIKVGVVKRKLGFLSESERALEKAIKKLTDRPKISTAYLYLARVYRDMEKYEKADSTLRAATEVNSKNAQAFLELIDLYKKHYPGKSDELDNIYQAGSDYSENPEIWASYARFLEDRREYRKAWIYWQEVSSAEPGNREATESVERLEELLDNNK